MSAQFVIAVTSSLTTAAILMMLRQLIKVRHIISQHANEHEFLMASMTVVLEHLKLEAKPVDRRKR